MDSETPYKVCKDKKTEDAFQIFAGKHPKLWDYNKAHISPLTPQMIVEREKRREAEQLEKERRKAEAQILKEKQNKIEAERRQKKEEEMARKRKEEQLEKVRQREENEKKRKEQAEVQEIMNKYTQKQTGLSDREKRAMAAERRMKGNTLPLCAFCSTAIPSTPFERLTFVYCSPKCVVSHKRALENIIL